MKAGDLARESGSESLEAKGWDFSLSCGLTYLHLGAWTRLVLIVYRAGYEPPKP